MPRSRGSAKRRGGQSQGGLLVPLRMAAGFFEAVKTNRVLQLGTLGLIVILVILFLLVRSCSDDASFRRSQAAAKEMEGAGIAEAVEQPGARPAAKSVAEEKGKNGPTKAAVAPSGNDDVEEQPGAMPPTRAGSGRGAPNRAQPGKPPVAVALPEKFADWKEKDFLLAKSTGDHRLLPALQDYIQRARGTEGEVRLYRALLQPSSTNPSQSVDRDEDDENPRQRQPAASGLTATLVAALAANGTPAARDALRQLLAGALTTDDDRTAVDAVLRTLAERPSQDNEELLHQVLAAPGKLRPPGQGSVSADAIQAKACDLVRRNASDQLRLRIAEAAADPATPETFRKRLRAIVEQLDPRNTEPQIVLYQGGVLEGPARAAMEKRLAAISGDALLTLMVGESKTSTIADANLLRRACCRLWGEQFTSWLALHPHRIESLEEGSSLLLLAATIPSERVRTKLLRGLKRYIDAGPSALARTAIATNVATEPGFLVAIKSVERQLGQASRGDAARVAPALRSEEARKQFLQRQEQREKTVREWNDFSENVLRAWCRRLHAAATSGGPRPSSGTETAPSPIKLAFRTHADGENAEMVGAYRFDLPGVSGDGFVDRLDFLQVRYARIEERTRISRLVDFYRRQLDGEVWSVDDGAWLDCLLVDSASGRRRSLDVLITSRVKTKGNVSRPGNEEEGTGRRRGKSSSKPASNSFVRPKWKPGMLPDDEQELIVDILSIEVNLPEE